MKFIQFRTWTIPLALLLVCVLSFGLMAPLLGFYWDDWPSIWYLHILGPAGLKDVFSVDRPLLGWLFMLTTSLVGESTLGWQVFGVLTRWASCLALWWMLRSVWPQYKRQVTWVAFLFAVYPGFKQQYIAVTYGHDWIAIGLFFLSFSLMIWAVQRPSWFWPLMISSWLLSAYVMFADEYYFGLELLRPLILWIVLRRPGDNTRGLVSRVLKFWLPYIGIMIAFLIWRLFIYVSPRGKVQIFNSASQNPVGALLGLAARILHDIFQSSILAWIQILNISTLIDHSLPLPLLYAAIVLSVFLLMLVYQSRLHLDQEDGIDGKVNIVDRWAPQAMLIGVYSLLIAGWPFWTTDLPIGLEFPWDRFTLTMMLGASLLLAGLIDLIRRPRNLGMLLLSLAVGVAAGYQVLVANDFRLEWNAQKSFFWQLTWRAPAVQPGTTFLTADLPFTYFSDNSLTAPLNWIYAPDNKTRQMSYILYAIESRLGGGLVDLRENQPIQQLYRISSFEGNTSRSILIFYEPPGCVTVVDPLIDGKLPQKPNYISEAMPLSNLSLVQVDSQSPAVPPANIFGPEPAHDWCYAYEKADLARQQGDWAEIVKIGDQALPEAGPLYPVNAPELWPYIEGYAHLGKWKEAEDLTRQSYRLTFRMQGMLCANWARVIKDIPQSQEGQTTFATIQKELKCPSQP
jgi:hypothetical protein